MFNEATFREILLPSLPEDGRSISQNVASLNILVHDVINLLYYNTPITLVKEIILIPPDVADKTIKILSI